MKRRRFVLAGFGALGALAIGWSFLPPRGRLRGKRLDATDAGPALNGWVRVDTDSTVTVLMPKSEMGQGIHTALAQILAEELGAEWSQVRIEYAPIDAIYFNTASVIDLLPFHPESRGVIKRGTEWYTRKFLSHAGFMVTGGSSSVRDLWMPMRMAGASAQSMLVAAAAAHHDLPANELFVSGGHVHRESLHTVLGPIGFYAEAASKLPLDREPTLRSGFFSFIGRPMPRLEGASKVDGSIRYGIDVKQPGQQYASVVMNPSIGGGVVSFDIAPARRDDTTIEAFAVEGRNGGTSGVAVIADSTWAAMRAAREVKVEWSPGPGAGVSSASAMQSLRTALDESDGMAYFKRGDWRGELEAAATRVRAEYSAPYLAHLALEPMNCTVLVEDGRATVWAPTQAPNIARLAVARALDLSTDDVDLRVQFIGGGFGRRLDVDFIAQAALVASHKPGVPVQTVWSREEDTRHDFYRPACVARLDAGLNAAGDLVSWTHTSASQSIHAQGLKRYLGTPLIGPDKVMIEGAFDQSYEWPAARIAHVKVTLPIPIGWWRSVGHSHQAFFKESFLDEVAHAAGRDPVAFRSALLANHPRQAHVLTRAAELAGWGTPLAARRGVRVGRGIALHQSYGSTVAHVAEVEVNAQNAIRVRRVVAVADCGIVINPNHARQQIEGGIQFGLSATFGNAVTIEDGKVVNSNFHDVPVLRMADAPRIAVEFVRSEEPPEGLGEVAVPPIAPAVANAVFAATGQRLRDLPLKLG